MATTGREISHKLANKRDEVQRQARIVTSQIAGLERELSGVVQEQARLLQQLASMHLKQDVALPKNIENMLRSRDQRISDSKAKIKTAEQKINELRDQREGVARDTNAAFEVYDKANKEANLRYEEDADAIRLRSHLASVNEVIASLVRKMERAQSELAEKRVAYEEDPFFSYLIKRNYGESEYNSFGLTARIDGWLANLISFKRKKGDYDILHAIPKWFNVRIQKVNEDHEADVSSLEAIYRRTHEHVLSLKEKVDTSNKLLKQIDNDISVLRSDVRQASEYISEAALATDDDLFRITKTYAEQMAKLGISDLYALARKTEGKEDDQIVAQISALEASHKNISVQILHLQPGKLEFEKRMKELDEAESMLRRRGWSGSSDRFSDKLDDRTIENLATGVITASVFWDAVQRSHRQSEDYYSPRVSRSSTYGSSTSSSSWDSSSGSSSWGSSSSSDSGGFGGSSSWSSGGGFGGGDSSTGGGF